jgi:hypothetical protein
MEFWNTERTCGCLARISLKTLPRIEWDSETKRWVGDLAFFRTDSEEKENGCESNEVLFSWFQASPLFSLQKLQNGINAENATLRLSIEATHMECSKCSGKTHAGAA